MSAKHDYYLFRLFTSKGADLTECFEFPKGTAESEVKCYFENYADRYVNGTAIEAYTVQLRKITLPDRREILSKYKAASKKRRKIERQVNELAAILNPRKASV